MLHNVRRMACKLGLANSSQDNLLATSIAPVRFSTVLQIISIPQRLMSVELVVTGISPSLVHPNAERGSPSEHETVTTK